MAGNDEWGRTKPSIFPVSLAHTLSWNEALKCIHTVPYSKSTATSSPTVQLYLSFYKKFYLESVEQDFLLISQLILVALLQTGGQQDSQDVTFTLWLQRDNSKFLALHLPSAYPALMLSPTSQNFLKNSKYLCIASISKKNSAPIWGGDSPRDITDVAKFKYHFLVWNKILETLLFVVGFGRLYVGHHLHPDSWKPAIVR